MNNLNWDKIVNDSYKLKGYLFDAMEEDFRTQLKFRETLNRLTNEILKDQKYDGQDHLSLKYLIVKTFLATFYIEMSIDQRIRLTRNLKEALEISWSDDKYQIIDHEELDSQLDFMKKINAGVVRAQCTFQDKDGEKYEIGYYLKHK